MREEEASEALGTRFSDRTERANVRLAMEDMAGDAAEEGRAARWALISSRRSYHDQAAAAAEAAGWMRMMQEESRRGVGSRTKKSEHMQKVVAAVQCCCQQLLQTFWQTSRARHLVSSRARRGEDAGIGRLMCWALALSVLLLLVIAGFARPTTLH